MKSLATYDYKKWGHRYIDELVRMGVDRNTVYRRMARRMKVHHSVAHFSRTNDDPVLWKMVETLEKMKIARQNEIKGALKSREPDDPALQAIRQRKERENVYKIPVIDRELLREVGRKNQKKKSPVHPWGLRFLVQFLLKLFDF